MFLWWFVSCRRFGPLLAFVSISLNKALTDHDKRPEQPRLERVGFVVPQIEPRFPDSLRNLAVPPLSEFAAVVLYGRNDPFSDAPIARFQRFPIAAASSETVAFWAFDGGVGSPLLDHDFIGSPRNPGSIPLGAAEFYGYFHRCSSNENRDFSSTTRSSP